MFMKDPKVKSFASPLLAILLLCGVSIKGAVLSEFQQRDSIWKPGFRGFITITNFESEVQAPPVLLTEPYPLNPHLIRYGVPFDLPDDPDDILGTPIEEEGTITVPLPSGGREIFLLISAVFPDSEFFGDGGERPLKLTTLNEPERVCIELTYSDGSTDTFIPANARKPSYGIERGLGLYFIHPPADKKPVSLTLRDRMRNAGFGIWAITVNTRKPVAEEPIIPLVYYNQPKKAAPDALIIEFNSKKGLAWGNLQSKVWGGKIDLSNEPVFLLKLVRSDGSTIDLPSTVWKIQSVKTPGNKVDIILEYDLPESKLEALLNVVYTGIDEALLTLEIKNTGDKPLTGTLFFPTLSGIMFKDWEDTWYFSSRVGGVINKVAVEFRDRIGELHPMQVDGFFSIKAGGGLCLMTQDLTELYRWYRLGKDDRGGKYAIEYLEQTVAKNQSFRCAPVMLCAVPGDWKDQFTKYLQWKSKWYKPIAPRPKWFRDVFAFASCYTVGDPDFTPQINAAFKSTGACDFAHLFGWAINKDYGHWGDYNHFSQFGKSDEDGKKTFKQIINYVQTNEIPVGLYLDGYLVSREAKNPPAYEREQMAICGKDGKPIKYYGDALSMCLYLPQWREYLTSVYKRLATDLSPNGLYIDEFGRNLENRTCYSPDHGHPVPAGMAPAEGLFMKQIRHNIPQSIVLYSEFVPSDVASQYLDGAFSYIYPCAYLGDENWWLNKMNKDLSHERIAPHYVNLHRFAFPDFKTFHIIYSVPHQNGNWFLLRYPFFNGEGIYLKGEAVNSVDKYASSFYKKIFAIQHKYKYAFTSEDIEPLVATEAPHLFANRFSAQRFTVWTLYNANYRTLRGALLKVKHKPSAQYYDVWNNRKIVPQIKNDIAELTFEIGARSVGCIVQEIP